MQRIDIPTHIADERPDHASALAGPLKLIAATLIAPFALRLIALALLALLVFARRGALWRAWLAIAVLLVVVRLIAQ